VKRRVFVFLVSILIATAHRLPAPIQEIPESPTPIPKTQAKPKAPAAKHTQSPPEKKSVSPFAGTWEGAATVTCSNGDISNWPSIMVVFPAGAGMVRTRWVDGIGSINGPFVAGYAVNDGIARWNFTGTSKDRQTNATNSMSMRMVDSRAAAVSLHFVYTSGDYKGVSCDVTGTLIRQ